MTTVFDAVKYDKLTGLFTWAFDVSSKCRAGKPAGCPGNDGYIRIGYRGKYYKAHRLAWEIHNGPIPEGYLIDHRDGDRSNNSLENLRLATRQQNNQNSKPRCRKQGLPRNIRKLSSGYQVVMKIGKVKHRFGVYADLDSAVLVEKEMRAIYHGDFIYDICTNKTV